MRLQSEAGATRAAARTWRVPGLPSGARRRETGHAHIVPAGLLLTGLCVLLAGALLLGIAIGPVRVAPLDVLRIVASHLGVPVAGSDDFQQDAIVWAIRLPRVLLGALVGAGFAVAGAALQGVFRNPLADPAVIGVATGASLGAVAAIVLGVAGSFYGGLQVCAFLGGVVAALVVYVLARSGGRTDASTLILTGIAVTSIAGAGVGFLIARADDDELRDVVFWTLGSLGSATWPIVAATAPFVAVGVALTLARARGLDLLGLGEREARSLGVETERLRLVLVGTAALAASAAVAAAGVVMFVGLVVPHIVRLLAGPAHRTVLIGSALLGAALLVLADLVARTATAPVELPLGVVTALVGGPVFLWLVRRTPAGAR